ncbi:MAG: hypothetical protein OXC07_12595 [Kistimonas sp.]|nr:hypothetical protein [Kistimonas sp.]
MKRRDSVYPSCNQYSPGIKAHRCTAARGLVAGPLIPAIPQHMDIAAVEVSENGQSQVMACEPGRTRARTGA